VPPGTQLGRSPANRLTRDDMMIRKAMVIPLGHRNPHGPGSAASVRV